MRKEPAGGHLKDEAPRVRAPKGLTCLHCHRERGKEGGRERTHGTHTCTSGLKSHSFHPISPPSSPPQMKCCGNVPWYVLLSSLHSFLPRSHPPSHPPSLPSSRCFRLNLPCRKRVGKRREIGRLEGGAIPRPMIDLIIEQSDPRFFTEVYMQVGRKGGSEGGREGGRDGMHLIASFSRQTHMQAFAQIYDDGLIDHDKVRSFLPPFIFHLFSAHTLPPSLPHFFPHQVLNMLQLWNTASTIMDSDLSWGIGARIAQVWGAGGQGRKRAFLRPLDSVTFFPQAMATGRSSRLPLFRSLPSSFRP